MIIRKELRLCYLRALSHLLGLFALAGDALAVLCLFLKQVERVRREAEFLLWNRQGLGGFHTSERLVGFLGQLQELQFEFSVTKRGDQNPVSGLETGPLKPVSPEPDFGFREALPEVAIRLDLQQTNSRVSHGRPRFLQTSGRG